MLSTFGAEMTSASATPHINDNFSFLFLSSATGARPKIISGWRPAEFRSRTACCVGFVLRRSRPGRISAASPLAGAAGMSCLSCTQPARPGCRPHCGTPFPEPQRRDRSLRVISTSRPSLPRWFQRGRAGAPVACRQLRASASHRLQLQDEHGDPHFGSRGLR